MSSKQLVSPRKPKKRPYRRRIRNKKNQTDKLTNISNTDKLKPMKVDSNINNIPIISHSRTLSYISPNHHKQNNETLSAIQIETDSLAKPNINNNNNNFLSFNKCNQNLSVSLPSSPINRTNSNKNIKNKRFNNEIANKLQRGSSMNNINDKRNTPITRIKTPKHKRISNESTNNENIKVMIRFRPYNKTELAYSMVSDEIIFSNKNKKISLNYYGNNKRDTNIRSYSFKCDKIFNLNTTQKTIFKHVSKPICDDLLQFKSNYGTIFCYGQSGSGKTYTMTGPQRPVKKSGYSKRANSAVIHRRCRSERLLNNNSIEQCGIAVGDIECMGIIGRSCCYIFDELSDLKDSLFNVYTEFTYNIYIECIEIYNEKLKDLLNSKNIPIIREIKNRKNKLPFYRTEIQNITRKHVKSIKEILNILQIASLNRNIHRTSLNETSSRSHMIIRLIIKTFSSDTNKSTESILNFVDLAGSENLKKTKNSAKKQVVEAGNILKSLTTLSQVIDALIKNKKHIPYKDSKLTRVLSNSLGGNCKTALLICASPHIYNRYETIRSIKFGIRCLQIKNYIKYNYEQIISDKKCNNNSKPALKLTDSKSLTLSLTNNSIKSTETLELENNKSIIIREKEKEEEENSNNCNKCEYLNREIEKLNIENDLLKSKDELNENINILNETISKIALQNLFKSKNKNNKSTKKIKKNNKKNKKGIENELNIFESKLIQITIGLNGKMDKIKELISDGLNMCENEINLNINKRNSEGLNHILNEGNCVEDINNENNDTFQKENNNLNINSINFNQKIYSETMVQQLKQQNEELIAEINKLKGINCDGQSVSSIREDFKLVKTPKRESNSTNISERLIEENDTYYICDDNDIYHNIYDIENNNNNNNTMNSNREVTLSEQLNIMEKMRRLDKNNWDLVQSSSINLMEHSSSSHRISPRDSITLLKNTKLLPHTASNTSSARSSINSQSVVSTTIESIDEHLEKWNNGINNSQKYISYSNINNNNPRSSSSFSSINTLDLEQSVTEYNECDIYDPIDPILKEENEETEIDSSYDYYSETDDEQSYYNNNSTPMLQRTKTDSQIFRSIGMELSKKLKAKSVESPCQNNQRLSSTFAIHWINLKNIK